MQLSEHRRQAYLDAMGIQVWFPRVELPYAMPARSFEGITDALPAARLAPMENTGPQEACELQTASTARKVPGSSDIFHRMGLAELLPAESSAKMPEIQRSPPVEEKVEEKVEKTGAAPQFRLVVVPLGQHHLAITEMPYTGLNQFSRYHLRLLQDIARALQLPAPRQQFREFTWPLSKGAVQGGLLSLISQNDRAAAEAVGAFLQNQFGLSRQHVILLFGQAAARFVIDSGKPFDTLRGVQSGLFDNQQVAVTYSLNELMKIPALKASAWIDLQPLLSRTLPDQ